jgi:hypothetical protein
MVKTEAIIRDLDMNATARCTAITTLREIPQPAVDESLHGTDVLLMTDGNAAPTTPDGRAERHHGAHLRHRRV